MSADPQRPSASGSSSGDVFEALWYSPSPSAAAARAALAPLSLLFGAGVRMRAALYDRGVARAWNAPVPVLSVGSLRVGGAGKTPFVLWLARELRRRGRRPCIVTRGYGGRPQGSAPWVLEEAAAMTPGAADRAGDEAVLLALRSGGPVVIGADRARACEKAAAELAGTGEAPDLFLLDDGFQHRRLSRGLDIVLVTGGEGEERLLPAGPLREPVAALARANVVVTMRDDGLGRAAAPVAERADSRATLRLEACVRAQGVVASVADATTEPLSVLDGRRIVAVAGVARPERFLVALERAGARVTATVLRRDHHRYGDADLREIDSAAADADLVVTTEKDLVKLAGSAFRAPLVGLRIDVSFASAAEEALLTDRAASLR